MKSRSYAGIALGLLALTTLLATAAEARPGGGRGQRPQARSPRPEVVVDTETAVDESVTEADTTMPETTPDTATTPDTDSDLQGLPPGLQRQVDSGRGLPPGLQRQVDSGRGLPPGLQRQVDRGQQ
jgi:hypothetical protein